MEGRSHSPHAIVLLPPKWDAPPWPHQQLALRCTRCSLIVGPGESLPRAGGNAVRAVTGGIGSGSRTRTYDPRINSPLLYQLSYAGVRRRA